MFSSTFSLVSWITCDRIKVFLWFCVKKLKLFWNVIVLVLVWSVLWLWHYKTNKTSSSGRALPEIPSGPEVQQNFKIRTIHKPNVFLPGCRTFNTFENRKKNPRNFFRIFLVYLFGLGTFYTVFVFRDLILWELIACTY